MPTAPHVIFTGDYLIIIIIIIHFHYHLFVLVSSVLTIVTGAINNGRGQFDIGIDQQRVVYCEFLLWVARIRNAPSPNSVFEVFVALFFSKIVANWFLSLRD